MDRRDARRIIHTAWETAPDLMGLCESPVEELFLGQYLLVAPVGNVEVQADRSPYRVDFLLTGRHVVAIEIDGWEFHRGSLERARADVRRDRYLWSRYGIHTDRFLASEVLHDPLATVVAACGSAGIPTGHLHAATNRLALS